MKVASLLLLTLGAALLPAICQTTVSQPSIAKEMPSIYTASLSPSAEWKLFPSESEGIGGLAFPAAALFVTPIAPSPAAAVSNLVQPELRQSGPTRMEWKLSLLALAAAHSADAATSWNKRELNPLLSPNSGAFGVQTLAIKCVITAGSIGLQAFLLRRHPEFAKMFGRINFMESGVIGATAIHNSFVQGR